MGRGRGWGREQACRYNRMVMRRVGRRLLGLGLIIALLGVGAAIYVYDYPRVAADLPDAARDYRAAGLPWTAADLAPNPSVRPEENAAPGLRAALAAWPQRTSSWKGETQVAYADPLGSAALQGGSVVVRIARVAPALRLVHEAVARPRLDFGRDWDLGQSAPFSERPGFKAIASTLAARAETRAAGGDDAGALADLEDACRLGVLVASEPTILSAFVGGGCETSALKGVLVCLTRAAGDPRRLEVYRDWLARPVPTIDLNRALRGELYSIVATLRNLESRDMMPDPLRLKAGDVPDLVGGARPLRRDGFPPDLRDRAYLARCLRRWTELAEATHGLTDPVDRIGQEAEWIESSHQEVMTAISFYEFTLFPIYSNLGRTNRSLTTRRALALAFADALVLHAREGRWPASVPVPDPFGEGDLKVRLDGGRFRVYSVGEDGRDDGGLAPGETAGPGPHGRDIVAVYPPISTGRKRG